MHPSKEDLPKFTKLGVHSVLDLALTVPASYEDLNLYEEIRPHAQIFEVSVEAIVRTPKALKIELYAHNIEQNIEAVMFRPKPYMMRQFYQGERCYIYGVLEQKGEMLSIAHPKKVSRIGGITARYKTPLRNDSVQALMRRYMTHEQLLTSGLPEDIVKKLLEIHFPKRLQGLEQFSDTLKYTELYNYMQQLCKKKKNFEAKECLSGDSTSWIASLPFALTKEQQKAIDDIKKDFAKGIAARRMIVGDVGSGKTMVMLAAAFMAHPHKSVLMAPTSILADQLFCEAQRFLPNFKSTLVTNKTSKVDLGEYDLLIGTHALLYKELPKEVALVMIDEQHRFGTAQRAQLEKLAAQGKRRAHFLQFSATPIPRTQAMIQSAHIDVSLITSTPFEKNITTRVIGKKDFAMLLEHIKTEIAQQHQVLLVYPLVEQSEQLGYQSIEEARGFWESRFENVYVTHGKDAQKEQILKVFRDKGNILLATTVVEVGISLPRLTTVVIVGAERLGLATLHQLRGRVGRNGLVGQCYLFTYQNVSERLERFSQTTNGFAIAELDLKLRKSGDLLSGKNQSGLQFRWVDLVGDVEVVRRVKQDMGI